MKIFHCFIFLLTSQSVEAEDLRSSLISAYNTNPTLAKARDNQRSLDAAVPLARADGLPSVNANVQENENLLQSPFSSVSPTRIATLGATLIVPIYSGGAVLNSVKAAKIRVIAGNSDLIATEASVFSQVVSSYTDVILNESLVRLNQAQVHALEVNLRATNSRFHAGDLTRTDVAQSESRLALAQGNLRSVQANLTAVREQYRQYVGKPPVDLQAPPPLPGLPATLDDALTTALDTNPDLESARRHRQAARYDTKAAEAGRLPRLQVYADSAHSDFLNSFDVNDYPRNLVPQAYNTADVGVRLTIPLYQGGRPTAQIRQAEAQESAAFDSEVETERQIAAQVRTAFSSWQAANDIISSTQKAVDAANISLQGVTAENRVGNRTILDILNAEQELVNAQAQLFTAQRNAYVAGFTLLAAMGKVGAQTLGLDGYGPLYDPDVHYRRVYRDVWDWGGDGRPVACCRSSNR